MTNENNNYLESQIELRKQKYLSLKEQNINPYPSFSITKDDISSLKKSFSEDNNSTEVKVCGRIITVRNMGKVIFATIKDQDDAIQLFIQKDFVGEDKFKLFKSLDIGDIIFVKGVLFKTKVGEITIRDISFSLLTKSIKELPEKFHGLQDKELKYRKRYLDLIANKDSFDVLKKRILMVKEIRDFLNSKGYMEVETPMMHSIAGGALAKPFTTRYNALNQTMYLRIATEIYLKQLLVGGFEKIYEMNRNFRNEGISRQHNPEFTSLELYHTYGDYQTMISLITELIQTVAKKVINTLQVKSINTNQTIDLANFHTISYQDIIKQEIDDNWFDWSLEEKINYAKTKNIICDHKNEHYLITQEVYEKLIEPKIIQPTFITHLPYQLVPLAKRNINNPSYVDVYELIIDGKEISPGYTELNDPFDQLERFKQQLANANSDEAESSIIDYNFIESLYIGMPPTGGLGLGIDRLAMILTQSQSIKDVILFPQLKKN